VVDFKIGETNTVDCPEGMEPILAKEECDAASKALGKVFNGPTLKPLPGRPRGCYNKGSLFAFNVLGEEGERKERAAGVSPVCKAKCTVTVLSTPAEAAEQAEAAAAGMEPSGQKITSPQPQNFAFGPEKTTNCPPGGTAIMDEATCQAAAAALAASYEGGKSVADRPAGCHEMSGQAFLNTAAEVPLTGLSGRPICLMTSSAAHSRTYHAAAAGAIACEQDALVIPNEAACQIASQMLGLSWKATLSVLRKPKGCMTNPKKAEAYWNFHARGGTHAEYAPLCFDTPSNVIPAAAATEQLLSEMQGATVDGQRAVDAKFFQIGESGYRCPLHSRAVKDQVACALASHQLGLEFTGAATDATKPYGCWKDALLAAGAISWNDAPGLLKASKIQLVCRTMDGESGAGSSGRHDDDSLAKAAAEAAKVHKKSHHKHHGGD